MKTLWLFTQIPNQENIGFLKRIVDNTDCVVFIQNGVYIDKQHIDIPCQNYVLGPDLKARGLTSNKEIIDYGDAVDLFFAYEKIITI